MRFSYEGDREKAWSFFDEAQHELFRLKERMTALGLTQGSFHASSTSGEVYAYGYVLPTGLEVIHIVAAPGRGDVTAFDYTDPKTPDFLSGYLVGGQLVEVPVDGGAEVRVRDFRPGASCVRLHPDEVSPGANQVRRLAIRPGDIAGLSEGAEISQAAIIRPTMYSGTMRKVVQFLLGLGKQFSDESIYDAAEPELPDEIIEESEEEIDEGDDETAYESTVKSQGVRIHYDHRFQRTHGVIRAADQRWWLVEISEARGVLMMPLPLCRYTDLPEFRQKCETLSDGEAIQVLDLFGGFPSGEPFPTDTLALGSAIRSGRVLRVKTADDVSAFYTLNGYSSVMGWAFSDSGSEAHNTGYMYDNHGYALGSHYAAQMSVGAFIDVEPDVDAETLKSILAEAEGDVHQQVYDELMWKVDRLSAQQVSDLLLLSNTKSPLELVELADELVLSPSAVASCSLSKVSEGYLYSRALYGPQVKFPEPILNGCVSGPLYQEDATLPQVSCDTTVHVFFAGEELKWAKYFYRPSTNQTRVTNDTYTGREDIPVGDFNYERHSGQYGVAPGFYTNNFDDRVERGESTYKVRYKRRFSGHYEILTYSYGVGDRIGDLLDRYFDPPIPWTNTMVPPPIVWRNARFAYEEWRESRNGLSMKTAITIPMEDRCSYFYTVEEGGSGGIDTYIFSYEIVTDPNVGHYPGGGDDTVSMLTSANSVGSSIWPNHQERIGFADAGPWLSVGVNVQSIVTNTSINLDLFSRLVTTIRSPQFTLRCMFVSASGHTPVEVFNQSKTGSDFYPSRWFEISPDPDSGVLDFVNSTHNVLGLADTLVYSSDINSTDRTLKGIPNDTVLRAVIPTFIGPFDA